MWQYFCKSLKANVDLFLPPAGLLCGVRLRGSAGDRDFCTTCMNRITPLEPAHCCLCARPFADATSSHLYGGCLQRPPPSPRFMSPADTTAA